MELPFTLPKKTLLDEMPALYRLLVNRLSTMEGCSEELLLVEGVVYSRLQGLASLLGVAISESSSSNLIVGSDRRDINLSVPTYHRMLLPVVWDLGRGHIDGSIQQPDRTAIRVLSFQARENSWLMKGGSDSGNSGGKKSRRLTEDLDNAVADKLQVHACMYLL